MLKQTKIYAMFHDIALQNIRILVLLRNFHFTLYVKNWMGFINNLSSLYMLMEKQKKGRSKRNIQKQCWDIFNELYYIYKEKYNEEKDGLNRKTKKEFDYTNLMIIRTSLKMRSQKWMKKQIIEEVKERDKCIDKRWCNHEPSILVSNLLSQHTNYSKKEFRGD